MTYFTRFPINMTRREAKSMLASPYRLHAAIAGSFPSACNSSDNGGRILWRIDRQLDGGMNLYIVSPQKPSLVGLDEQIGFPDIDQQWLTREYDSFLLQISEGQRYHFRLVANPIVKARLEDSTERKRVAHLTALQQAAWLAGKAAYIGLEADVPQRLARQEVSRAEQNGFTICAQEPSGEISLIVSDSKKMSFKKPNGSRLTIAMARYDGILEVIDANKIREALTQGIGHAKAFGCGLLTLVPYRG